MSGSAAWTCPTCGRTITATYCDRCGEKEIQPRDLTMRGLFATLFQMLTRVDTRTLRSFRTLILQPGELTRAWTRGVRKPYIAPFQFFLLANVLFFALQAMTGSNVFGSSLASHLHQQDWQELARSLLDKRLAVTHTTYEQYELAFDQAVVLNAKSLILLMTAPFALLLPLTFFRAHRPVMAHVTFALHTYTFLLLLFCLALLAAKLSATLGFGDLNVPMVDNVLTALNLAVCIVYIYFAIGPAYGATGVLRVVKAIWLAIAVGAIVVGYRFAIFLITLYST